MNKEPCSHPGCFSHISHPCEVCGRIGGKYLGKQTRDQIAKIMLLDGTPEQQEEVMEYIGILKRNKEVSCSVCGNPIPVSDDLPDEIINSDIWICDKCYYEDFPNYC